jgi:hypothetical protein
LTIQSRHIVVGLNWFQSIWGVGCSVLMASRDSGPFALSLSKGFDRLSPNGWGA